MSVKFITWGKGIEPEPIEILEPSMGAAVPGVQTWAQLAAQTAERSLEARVRELEQELRKPQGNCFQKRGAAWLIRFRRQEVTLKGRPAEVVRLLIENRGKALSGEAFYENLEQTQAGAAARAKLDPKARAELKTRLRQLGADRAEAERDGDAESLREIDAETESIAQQFRADTNLYGRPRQDASRSERNRHNVENNLSRFKKQVAEYPALAEHFKKSIIRVGSDFKYNPPADPHWAL